MNQSVNDAIYEAMYALPTQILHDTIIAARAFCSVRSGRPCPKLADFVDDPANESIAREVIRRIREGTLLSGDNSVTENPV